MSTLTRQTTRAAANAEAAKVLVRRWFADAMNGGSAAAARAVF